MTLPRARLPALLIGAALAIAFALAALALITRPEGGNMTQDELTQRFPDYAAFRTAAMAEMPVPADDLIVFDLPNAPLFQDIRANGGIFVPYMTRYLTDATVPFADRLGAGAAMLDLPKDRLIALIGAINKAVAREPELARLMEAMLTNSYRGTLVGSGNEISDRALIRDADDPAVRDLLVAIRDNPAVPAPYRDARSPIGVALAP